MAMLIEEVENGQDSGSDSGGSIGTGSGSGSGSATSGSSGNDSGSGGNDSGSGGNDSGSAGSAGSDGNGGSVSVSADSNESNGDVGNVDGNQNASDIRSSRAERIRQRQPIRLGSAGNRNTSDRNDATSAGEREFNVENDNEPVIRLGARTQGRPKSVNAKESASKSKLSEVKDLIKIFVESIFDVPAIALKQDFWKLSKDESKALTDALIDWLESMPNSDQSKIAEFIGKHLPVINLAMVAFFIVSDRVRSSIAVYQVTKAANEFSRAVNTPTGGARDTTVKTAMDGMFS